MVAGVGVQVEGVRLLLIPGGVRVGWRRTTSKHPVKVDGFVVKSLVGVAGTLAVQVLLLVRVGELVYLILNAVVKPAVTFSHLTLVFLYGGFGTSWPVCCSCCGGGGGRGNQLTFKLVIRPHWGLRKGSVVLTLGSDIIFGDGE